MKLIRYVDKGKFVLLLLDEEQYTKALYEIIRSIEKISSKICYVCFNKLYKEVSDEIKDRKMNIKKFFFIDTMSSVYEKHKSTPNCIFISAPTDFESLKDAITRAIEKEHCDMLIFDTISTLLMYEQSYPIIRFTHELTSRKNIGKFYLVLKIDHLMKEEIERITNDIMMFADREVKLDSEN